MKQIGRILGVFLFILVLFSLVLPFSALAAEPEEINLGKASEGWFSVEHNADLGVKMKVCVTHATAGKVYYDYVPGTVGYYTFTMGPGNYTVSLFRNVSGTSYRKLLSRSVYIKELDPLAQYRVSTTEITFSPNDSVGMKAAELCEGLVTDADKLVAVYTYIAANFDYDYDFAAKVSAGGVKNYVPNTNSVLEAKKGVCYDMSALFAAMCRSQGIPCRIDRGYRAGVYHAWNAAYTGGAWISFDVTTGVCRVSYEEAGSLDEIVINATAAGGYIKQS